MSIIELQYFWNSDFRPKNGLSGTPPLPRRNSFGVQNENKLITVQTACAISARLPGVCWWSDFH